MKSCAHTNAIRCQHIGTRGTWHPVNIERQRTPDIDPAAINRDTRQIIQHIAQSAVQTVTVMADPLRPDTRNMLHPRAKSRNGRNRQRSGFECLR